MDLATLNLHEVEGEGVEMPLLHPGTGEETGVTLPRQSRPPGARRATR